MFIANFQSIRPPFESAQEETLDWLVEAYAQAKGNGADRTAIKEKLWHVGCKPDRIAKRGHVLTDFQHQNWKEMEVYQLAELRTGKSLSVRSEIFAKHVDQVFVSYYPEGSSPPDNLIHVTCTGYVSPSGAQKIVSQRGWGEKTTVTHAYHMGCYGSIAAIRQGIGFLSASAAKQQVDVVHTEICCLHMNPSLYASDQMVTQSLFADGFMKYSLLQESASAQIAIRAVREEIVPNSTQAMTWNVTEWGFQMSLAKEVAVLIARHLPGYLNRLCGGEFSKAIFAVHPGGPKILTHIQKLLELSDEQMHYSFQVLREYGNMSSATLPHVWQKIVNDPAIPPHTPIISLAFGPGLTIAGAWMEKLCGS